MHFPVDKSRHKAPCSSLQDLLLLKTDDSSATEK